jgi:hypothetical protein
LPRDGLLRRFRPQIRFINKPLADWLGWARKDGSQHLKAVLGAAAFEQRQPMYGKALAGERVFFRLRIRSQGRGRVRWQTDYVPWADTSGPCAGSSSSSRT